MSVFSDLLDSNSDGIEVSYNACGVLAHMVSDGDQAWNITKPRRHEVCHRMVQAISRWNLQTKRNINYRYTSEIHNPFNSIHSTLISNF